MAMLNNQMVYYTYYAIHLFVTAGQCNEMDDLFAGD